MRSISNCELCGDEGPFNGWRTLGDQSVYICHDCYRKLEDIIGYSHKIVVEPCPTCHHRHGIKVVKYGPEDEGVKQCEFCHEWFSYTNKKEGHQSCEECCAHHGPEIEKTLHTLMGVPEDIKCPSCGRDIKKKRVVQPSGFVLEIVDCWYCGHSSKETREKVKVVPELHEHQKVLV